MERVPYEGTGFEVSSLTFKGLRRIKDSGYGFRVPVSVSFAGRGSSTQPTRPSDFAKRSHFLEPLHRRFVKS